MKKRWTNGDAMLMAQRALRWHKDPMSPDYQKLYELTMSGKITINTLRRFAPWIIHKEKQMRYADFCNRCDLLK